ncbi:hypothetical protein Lepto7375DRAFT_8204 [Leptolyngbya sp. PCC 7375]|nr:hypothetical protein Lepto7375DRAFT_8204 [Leptolyngbya sp. PCC 7375]
MLDFIDHNEGFNPMASPPQLRPKYSISVEVRMYEISLVEVPMPIIVRQGYLEVRI